MEPRTLEAANSILADLCSISEFYRTHRCSNIIRKFEQYSIQTQTPLDGSPSDQYRRLISDCTSLSHDLESERNTMVEFLCRNNPANLISTFSEEELKALDGAWGRVNAITLARKKLIEFAKGGMPFTCPNLLALVGDKTAERLVLAARGAERLSSMSVADVLSVGADSFFVGYVERSDLFRSIPPRLRRQVRDLVAKKVTLAARADCIRGELERSGRIGRRLVKEVSVAVEWLEKSGRRSGEGLKERLEEVGASNIGSKSRVNIVVRDDEKFKMKKRRQKGVVLRTTEESLALALEAIEIADEEKKGKDSSSGS